MRRWILVFVLGALVAAGCGGDDPALVTTTAPDIETSGELSLSFDWSMPARFGLDANADGRIDVPNTFEYVHNLAAGECPCEPFEPSFDLTLTAGGDATDFEWLIEGPAGPESEVYSGAGLNGREVTISLREGTYDVTLTGTDGERTGTARTTVDVEDILIVAIGDSYAGGEGNPEVGLNANPSGALWADDGIDGITDAEADHAVAHRSTLGPSAQAALALEAADQRTSVTFVFLASTGATIDEGILGAQDERRPPQLDRVAAMIGCTAGICDRTIDALTISIGGNDVGFSFTIGSLIALDRLLTGSRYEGLRDVLMSSLADNVPQLEEAFGRLAASLSGMLEIRSTHITQYPMPSRTFDPDGTGDDMFPLCDEVADDLVFGLEVDDEELLLAEELIAKPLSDAIADAAEAHGWYLVTDHLDGYRGHGYCGTDPYEASAYPGNTWPQPIASTDDPTTRFFRQARESAVIQGDDDSARSFAPEQLATNGTLHPNELGHQLTAAALVSSINGVLSQ